MSSPCGLNSSGKDNITTDEELRHYEVRSHFSAFCDVDTDKDKHQERTTLLDMKDDCILQILSMKCLGIIDLCSAAESCRRLKEIAIRAFKRLHKTCNIRTLSKGETKTAKRILSNFGSDIRHLKIDREGLTVECLRQILASVTEHCSSTLQSLELQSICITENSTTELRPLFKNLQLLKINCCTFKGSSKELLADCRSLVALNVIHFETNAPAFILENTFPKLQQFEGAWLAVSDLMESFILRHMDLKSLKILTYLGTSALQRITDCKRLETLKCLIPQEGTFDLSNLGNLRELNLNCANVSEVRVLGLENLKFLESLKLDEPKVDSELVRTLSQLKGLRVLTLRQCTGIQNLHRIGDLGQLTTLEIWAIENVDLNISLLVKRLSKLNSLTVAMHGFKMDLETYLRVVDVVRGRTDRSKLKLQLVSCDKKNYDHLLPHFGRYAHVIEMIVQ